MTGFRGGGVFLPKSIKYMTHCTSSVPYTTDYRKRDLSEFQENVFSGILYQDVSGFWYSRFHKTCQPGVFSFPLVSISPRSFCTRNVTWGTKPLCTVLVQREGNGKSGKEKTPGWHVLYNLMYKIPDKTFPVVDPTCSSEPENTCSSESEEPRVICRHCDLLQPLVQCCRRHSS